MKRKIFIISLFICMLSCDNNSGVVIRKSNGIVLKYLCKVGKDTSNSTEYRYYQSVLLSKTDLVRGKKEGSVIDYYPDGKINIITNYKNGIANGVNKVFNEDGLLIRRSFYIDNKQVLFESIMENTVKPLTRKKIISLIDNKATWAGELFINTSSDSNVIDVYHGMYVNVIVDDTVNFANKLFLQLDIFLPTVVFNPEILIGEFDVQLKCIDTSYYAIPDSLGDKYTFTIPLNNTGNNYIIGRLNIPDKYLRTDIYFFKGFYVKEE